MYATLRESPSEIRPAENIIVCLVGDTNKTMSIPSTSAPTRTESASPQRLSVNVVAKNLLSSSGSSFRANTSLYDSLFSSVLHNFLSY